MSRRECEGCGALLKPTEAECPHCSATAVVEGVLEAKTRIRRDEAREKESAKRSGSDPYAMLERQARSTTEAQKLLGKLVRTFRAAAPKTTEEAVEIANAADKLVGRLATLGNQASKVAKEMLAFQSQRHKMVDQMTNEDRIAHIYAWFERQQVPMMDHIIESLTDIRNLAKTKRLKSAAEKQSRRKGLEVV